MALEAAILLASAGIVVAFAAWGQFRVARRRARMSADGWRENLRRLPLTSVSFNGDRLNATLNGVRLLVSRGENLETRIIAYGVDERLDNRREASATGRDRTLPVWSA